MSMHHAVRGMYKLKTNTDNPNPTFNMTYSILEWLPDSFLDTWWSWAKSKWGWRAICHRIIFSWLYNDYEPSLELGTLQWKGHTLLLV